MEIKRGDIIDIDFDPARGHEIRKTRPAVVVQNDIGNQYSPLVIVSPIRGAEHINEIQGRQPKTARDMQQVFDAKDVDAVLIATPDHWHGPASVFACQAGKDVYVEKPHAHNIWESRKMVEAGGKVVEQMYGRFPDEPHQQNFIECVKSRKRPTADIETLHPSCSMLHLANIAHRVGNLTLKYDSRAERFIDNEGANRLVKRDYRAKYEIPETV